LIHQCRDGIFCAVDVLSKEFYDDFKRWRFGGLRALPVLRAQSAGTLGSAILTRGGCCLV
jgi:hypothetical protein